MHAAFASYTRQPSASKWRAEVAQKPTINPSDSDLQLFGDAMSAF
jgi:hypothetical protein